MTPSRFVRVIVFRLLFNACVYSRRPSSSHDSNKHGSHSAERPLIKPPKRTFKTVLFLDGGGLRNIISTVLLVEVEHSIKHYLLSHPELLPEDADIHSIEDFVIELADYFDIMTGVSAGGWMALYLASRGGQGFARGVLDDPAIVQEYGRIHPGSAEGLIVFFREYGDAISPSSIGPLFDISSPSPIGVFSAVTTTDGIATAMEAFVGNMTMADLDTSLIVPSYDLISGFSMLFVANAFGDVPISSSAKMVSRFAPRSPGSQTFAPDLQFDEGANYYLKDVAAATGALPIFTEAKAVSRVGNSTVEFLCIDGDYPVDSPDLVASAFVMAEHNLQGFEEIAIMSLGSGTVLFDWKALANAGPFDWLRSRSNIALLVYSGGITSESLLDYIYYSNPKTKPYQYLKINKFVPVDTEEGSALAFGGLNISFIDANQAFGQRLAQEYRPSIDIFVRDFIFG